MTCEVCPNPTSAGPVSDEPAEEQYFTMECVDEEGPGSSITYEFCSMSCLQLFSAPVGQEHSND